MSLVGSQNRSIERAALRQVAAAAAAFLDGGELGELDALRAAVATWQGWRRIGATRPALDAAARPDDADEP